MIENLKKEIKQNNDIYDVLKDCTDDFLLENQSIILAALNGEELNKGYKISLSIIEDDLVWKYIPTSEDKKIKEKIIYKSQSYKYKLPEDWNSYYLIDLNDILWTENKRDFAASCKEVLGSLDTKVKFKGFWLHGIPGSGKTYGIIALLNMIAEKNKTVAFVNIPDLISKTHNSFNFNNSNDNYQFTIEQIKKVDVIIIDDLGSERPTPWFKENILLPIIDYRLKSNKPTFFTSNYDLGKYGNKLKHKSQNPELEEGVNTKIISIIRGLISSEIKIG